MHFICHFLISLQYILRVFSSWVYSVLKTILNMTQRAVVAMETAPRDDPAKNGKIMTVSFILGDTLAIASQTLNTHVHVLYIFWNQSNVGIISLFYILKLLPINIINNIWHLRYTEDPGRLQSWLPTLINQHKSRLLRWRTCNYCKNWPKSGYYFFSSYLFG